MEQKPATIDGALAIINDLEESGKKHMTTIHQANTNGENGPQTVRRRANTTQDEQQQGLSDRIKEQCIAGDIILTWPRKGIGPDGLRHKGTTVNTDAAFCTKSGCGTAAWCARNVDSNATWEGSRLVYALSATQAELPAILLAMKHATTKEVKDLSIYSDCGNAWTYIKKNTRRYLRMYVLSSEKY